MRESLKQKISEMKEKLRELLLNQKRGISSIGVLQGSHVSAYALFQQIIKSLESNDTEEQLLILLQVLDSYVPDKKATELFDLFKDLTSELSQQIEILNRIKTNSQEEADALELAISSHKEHYLELLLSHFVSTHLALRNLVPDTTYPEEFNEPPPTNEGAQVKKALTFFRSLSQQDSESDNKLNDIIEGFCTLIFYPKISASTLYDETNPDHKKTWGTISKKYRSGTRPRDNDFDKLCQALEKHIHLIFLAFPALRGPQESDQHTLELKISNSFLNYFLSANINHPNSWNLQGKELEKIIQTVTRNTSVLYAIGESSASSSDSSNRMSIEDEFQKKGESHAELLAALERENTSDGSTFQPSLETSNEEESLPLRTGQTIRKDKIQPEIVSLRRPYSPI